ncbi:MAG: tetratricopeptide repeat protein [Gemmobacter sp.]
MTQRFPIRSRLLIGAFMTSVALSLAACESSEDRAERHYRSALSLLERGDTERAMIELRNVFRYDGFHREARQTYANLLMEAGRSGEAYSQYLRLIEQYPDALDVRIILAGAAFERADWAEVERHGKAAIALAPDNLDVKAIAAALDYRAARLARDEEKLSESVTRIRNLRNELAQSGSPAIAALAQRIVVDRLANSDTPLAALPEIDRALERDPTSFDYHLLRLRLLATAQDLAGTGEQLKRMFELFPENERVQGSLINYYVSQGDLAEAEALLRGLAGPATENPERHAAVVQFLNQTQGVDAARQELERLAAAAEGHPNADQYRAMIAAIEFERGNRGDAIALLETILQGAQPSDETRRIKVALARMLAATDNRVGARARVEEILAEDSSNVEALKLRAAWAIDEDRPGAAIIDLRAALDQAPRDPQIMTLMAAAHERDGARELAGERLALAVEVSGSGAEESLRYAQYLLRENRAATAITVLTDARRLSPSDPRLAVALAEIYLNQRDLVRAREMATQLRQMGAEGAESAERIEAAALLVDGQTEAGEAQLRRLVEDGRADASVVAAVIQTQLAAGRAAEARIYLDDLITKSPEDRSLRLISASLYAASANPGAAEQELRNLLQRDPADERATQMLYGLLLASNRRDEARAALQAGLQANQGTGALAFLWAGELERDGDIDGAIGVYEKLYENDRGNAIVANNLASLITTHRTGPEDLERAYAIARRLRGVEVPAFQDTYGWIEYRRGNIAEALLHLEPAARGLPTNALVQYHLAMAYAAADRPEEAKAQFERALELAGDSPLPQFQQAREMLEKLRQP